MFLVFLEHRNKINKALGSFHRLSHIHENEKTNEKWASQLRNEYIRDYDDLLIYHQQTYMPARQEALFYAEKLNIPVLIHYVTHE